MKRSNYFFSIVATVAALAAGHAIAQTDSANFGARATGGATIALPPTNSSALAPSVPTIQSWLTAVAGKTFTINAPSDAGGLGSVRVIVSGSGDSVNVQRIAYGTRQVHSVILNPLSPVGGYDWAANHGNRFYNYRVSLSPAGIGVAMIQVVSNSTSGDSIPYTEYHVLQGAVPVDALIARPSGYVFTAPQVYTSTVPLRY